MEGAKVKHTPTDTAMESIAIADTLAREGYSEGIIDRVVIAHRSHELLLRACRRAFYLIKEGGFTHPMTEEFYDDTLRRLESSIVNAGGALTNEEPRP